MHSVTTSATLECLRRTFAIHGIAETVVTDNGTCFISEEFASCMSNNGIQHICVAPYHPASNGKAERAVQTFKQGFARRWEEQSKPECPGSYSVTGIPRKAQQGCLRQRCY